MENGNYKDNYYDEYEIDLVEYIMLLWNHKLFIGVFILLAVIFTFIYSVNFIVPTYKNSMTVQLANTEGRYSKTEQMNQLFKSKELINSAFEKNNLEYDNITKIDTEIISNLKLTDQGMQGSVYGGIIQIEVKSRGEDKLFQSLKAITSEFELRSNDYFNQLLSKKKEHLLTLKNEIDYLDKEIDTTNKILNNFKNVSIDKAFIVANINDKLNTLLNTKKEYISDYQHLKMIINDHRSFKILNPPVKNSKQINPNIKLNLAISAILGLMLAVFIVFFKKFIKEADLNQYEE